MTNFPLEILRLKPQLNIESDGHFTTKGIIDGTLIHRSLINSMLLKEIISEELSNNHWAFIPAGNKEILLKLYLDKSKINIKNPENVRNQVLARFSRQFPIAVEAISSMNSAATI